MRSRAFVGRPAPRVLIELERTGAQAPGIAAGWAGRVDDVVEARHLGAVDVRDVRPPAQIDRAAEAVMGVVDASLVVVEIEFRAAAEDAQAGIFQIGLTIGHDVARAPVVADAVRLDALPRACQRDAANGIDHLGVLPVGQSTRVHIDGFAFAGRSGRWRCRRASRAWTAIVPAQSLVEASGIAQQRLACDAVDGLGGIQIAAVARHPCPWDASGSLRDQVFRQHPKRLGIRVRAKVARVGAVGVT